MNLLPTELAGCVVVAPSVVRDQRGFFARVFCEAEFADANLDSVTAQVSLSFNDRKGTLRGLHFQRQPHSEAKLVRCIRGSVYDVAVDLRRGSPTRLRWVAVELNDENRLALYIPQGFGHGFVTLQDRTELLYQISRAYVPESSAGVRWDDREIAVAWPDLGVEYILSDRDRELPYASSLQEM